MLDLLSDACDDISVLRVMLFIKNLLNYTFTLIPLAAILFLSFDMAKNVFSNNIEEQRKNLHIFLRRFIYLVIIFFIPTIVRIVISLVSEEYDVGNYSKCLNVTSERIKTLTEKREKECINNYEEWDPVNNICLFVGEKTKLPDDFSIVQKREKKNVVSNQVNSLNRTFSGSRSKTMMEYAQTDSKWGSIGFCDSSKATIASSGCGASSLSMIITGYGNDPNATPKTVRDYICNNGLHDNKGMHHATMSNEKLMNHFGLVGEKIFDVSDKSKYGFGRGDTYSEKQAKMIKDEIDKGYAIILLVPGHYIAVDKGGCPGEQVYYYEASSTKNNGCMTMKELWNETWNRYNRCNNGGHRDDKCGWRWAWKYKPASTTN